MSLYKEQLTKPIPATDETHVEGRNHGLAVHIGIHKHAVDRLAKNRRKDIKLLDTNLSVSRGAHSHMFD